MANGQVRRDPGFPVAAEDQVEAHGEAVAVDAQIAEEAREAEHQDPARGTCEPDVEDADLIVQVAVEVHRLGQNRMGTGPRVGGAVASRRDLPVAQDLPAQLQQQRLIAVDSDPVGESGDLVREPWQLRRDHLVERGQHRFEPGHRDLFVQKQVEPAERVVDEAAQRTRESGAVLTADLVRIATQTQMGDARSAGHTTMS